MYKISIRVKKMTNKSWFKIKKPSDFTEGFGQWEDRTPDILGVNQTLVPAELTARFVVDVVIISVNEKKCQ